MLLSSLAVVVQERSDALDRERVRPGTNVHAENDVGLSLSRIPPSPLSKGATVGGGMGGELPPVSIPSRHRRTTPDQIENIYLIFLHPFL